MTLCVALIVLFTGQVAFAAVDQAQHDRGVAHTATDAAGVVLGLDDHHHDHPQAEADQGEDDTNAGAHRHADLPAADHVTAGQQAGPASPQLAALFLPAAGRWCGVGCPGPDHPPKA